MLRFSKIIVALGSSALLGLSGCGNWCQFDTDCPAAETCDRGFCAPYSDSQRAAGLCSTDLDCAPSEACNVGTCSPREGSGSPDGGSGSDGGGVTDGGGGSDGGVPGASWCNGLDPEAVYAIGNIAGHGPGFMNVEGSPLQYCFSLLGDSTDTQIRGSDGRLIYRTLATDNAVIYEFHQDDTDYMETDLWRVRDAFANDVALTFPPCEGNSLARWRLDPTTWDTFHQCDLTPGAPWYDISGTEITPHGFYGLGMTLDDRSAEFVITPEGAAEVSFPQFAGMKAGTVRHEAGGFLIATITDGAAIQAPEELWRLLADGTATKVGDYGALPATFTVENLDHMRKITSLGTLYLGGTLSGDRAIVRLEPDASAGTVIYEAAPLVATHGENGYFLRFDWPRGLTTGP